MRQVRFLVVLISVLLAGLTTVPASAAVPANFEDTLVTSVSGASGHPRSRGGVPPPLPAVHRNLRQVSFGDGPSLEAAP